MQAPGVGITQAPNSAPEQVGFSASGKIDRKEWGLTFNKVLDSGGLMIGETVKISLEVEAAKVK